MIQRRDRRRLLLGPETDDIMPGDFVRAAGFRGTGFCESVNGDHATVMWSRDRRDILPLSTLRRVKNRGSRFDRREPCG